MQLINIYIYVVSYLRPAACQLHKQTLCEAGT